MKGRLFPVLCLALASGASGVLASGQGTAWLYQGAAAVVGASGQLFSERERRILQDYLYREAAARRPGGYAGYEVRYADGRPAQGYDKKPRKQKALPPGLQKKLARGGSLPPGWQKKLARGEVMGADLYAASSRLPRDVLDRLPRGPEGTSIRRIEDRVVRVMDATRVILDVLSGR